MVETVQRERKAVCIDPAGCFDQIADLILSVSILDEPVLEERQRPGIVRVRSWNGGDLARRIGVGQELGEEGEGIGAVAGEVLVYASQAGAVVRLAARVEARRSGDDLGNGEAELVIEIVKK